MTDTRVTDIAALYLEEAFRTLRGNKHLAEGAMAQLSDEQFFAALDPESNSIAVIAKHMACNMRSRFTDFLTTDGEKPDRQRDQEFVTGSAEARADLIRRWEDGWQLVLDTVKSLSPEDLTRTVTIRGEPHSVLQAINRQAAHTAQHVGQIIFLAKHWKGSAWQTLSVPKGQSEQFNAKKIAERNKK
jgi:hypothetical protein